MADRWFLRADVDDVTHVHEVFGYPEDDIDIDDDIEAFRAALGIPAQHPVSFAPGMPHPSVLQRIPVDTDGEPVCGQCGQAVGPELKGT